MLGVARNANHILMGNYYLFFMVFDNNALQERYSLSAKGELIFFSPNISHDLRKVYEREHFTLGLSRFTRRTKRPSSFLPTGVQG